MRGVFRVVNALGLPGVKKGQLKQLRLAKRKHPFPPKKKQTVCVKKEYGIPKTTSWVKEKHPSHFSPPLKKGSVLPLEGPHPCAPGILSGWPL